MTKCPHYYRKKGVKQVSRRDASSTSDTSATTGGVMDNNINNSIVLPVTNTPPLPGMSQMSQVSLVSQEKQEPELTFDDDSEVVLHPSMGVFDDGSEELFYFGVNLNTLIHKEKKIGKEKKIMKFKHKEKRNVLITSNKKVLHKEDMDERGYIINSNMLMGKSNWKVGDIKKYLADDDFLLKEELIDIFNAIKEDFEYYIDFPEEESYTFFPIWIIGTYLTELFFSYPYIHLHGLKNTAKSKIMQLSSKMAFNSEYLGSLTNAVLFRIINQNKPTLFIDEYETLRKDKRSKEELEIEILLNNGYKKGMTVARMEQENNKWVVKKFNVYCPKMIANITGLTGALPSRCIKFIMHRAKSGDLRGERYPDKDEKDRWIKLRSKLYIYVLDHWQSINFGYYEMKPIEGICNRDFELWRPIFTIAKCISEEVYEKMVEFAKKKIKDGQVDEELEEGWEYKLIEVLVKLVEEEERYYYVKEITEELNNSFVERIETDYNGNEKKIYKKQKPTPSWVGKSLRRMSLTDYKKQSAGHQYNLTKKIVDNIISRLQINITKETKLDSSLKTEEVKEKTQGAANDKTSFNL